MPRQFPGNSRRAAPAPAAGFTLVEMMVTLALTLIMMYLFAVIFGITGEFVTKQKGLAENDQSARIFTTVLKNDLQARTMRYLAPFHPNMPSLGDDSNRQGYFYYSENNPTDDTDDVLQFTINMGKIPTTNTASGTQLYGLATNLPLPWQANTNYGPVSYVRPTNSAGSPATGFIYKTTSGGTSGGTEPTGPTNAWAGTVGGTTTDGSVTWTAVASAIDQPDGDDGVVAFISAGNPTINPPPPSSGGPAPNPNNTGSSPYAEVSYFLRHGNLCRRVNLIRNPYNLGSATTAQPLDTGGLPLIPDKYPPNPGPTPHTFWGDFDYAARLTPVNPSGYAIKFLAAGSLENSLDNSFGSAATLPIGRPDNRFGFDQVYVTIGTGPFANGAPREFALPYVNPSATTNANTITGTTPVFFGRYTDEETSNVGFQFPGNLPSIGGVATSPMSSAAVLGLDSSTSTMWLLNSGSNSTTPPTAHTTFALGPRRGDEILATNVVSFDVKIWDSHYSEVAGNTDVNRNGIIDAGPAFVDLGYYSPATAGAPGATGDFQQSKNAFPVYGPNIFTGYTVPSAGSNSWASGTFTSSTYSSSTATYNANNVFDTWYRTFNFDNLQRTYDGIPPNPPNPDANTVNAPAPYRPRVGNTWQASTPYALGALVDPVNTANGYVYKCTTAGTSGTIPAGQVDPFSLQDSVVTANAVVDGTVQWIAQEPANVQAIQITVKYLDPTQNQLRQVTIVQQLTQ